MNGAAQFTNTMGMMQHRHEDEQELDRLGLQQAGCRVLLPRVGQPRPLVGLRQVFETEDEWYLVMELVTGGELFERLVKQGPYSEKEASRLTRQMGEAIAWLFTSTQLKS